jgi:hypothetical protein
MLQESDTDVKVAVSLGRKLLGNSYTPESEYVNALAEYASTKQQQRKLFFLRKQVKVQIVQKKYQGDPPYRSIYECSVLESGHKGMAVFIQQKYLTAKPST